MTVEYIMYARTDHDKHMKRLKKEVQKDKHWTFKCAEWEPVERAIKALGFHLIRIESKYNKHKIIFAVD